MKRVTKADQRNSRIVQLVHGWRDGDEAQASELVRVMRPIVVSHVRKVVARGYAGQWNDIEQSAWEGIAEAVHSFDETRGVKFWTWATWRMRKHISIWLAANSGAVSLPYPAWQAGLKVDRYMDEHGLESDQLSDEDLYEISGTLYAREALAARNGSLPDVYDHDVVSDPFADDDDATILEFLNELSNIEDDDEAKQIAAAWCELNGYSWETAMRLAEVRYAASA